MRWLLSSVLLALVGLCQALSSSGSRLLVVLEDSAERDDYSKFWLDLENRGYQLKFESPKSDSLALLKHGERAYDHLILFPPKSKGLGPSLSPNTLLDFINKEGNVLLALSGTSPTPSAITSLLLEFEINLPPDRVSVVVDHFNYDAISASEKHDVILAPLPKALRDDVKNFFSGDGIVAVPRAVGQSLGNASPLLAPILRAPSTAYSYNPKDEGESVEDVFAVGQQISLVSAMQARNSARFTVLGSVEMLKDQWFDATVQLNDKETTTSNYKETTTSNYEETTTSNYTETTTSNYKETTTSNRGFATELTGWTFKELGVLKVGRLQHYLSEGISAATPLNDSSVEYHEHNPKIYRIKNDVTYAIEISEWTMDHWSPFPPPANDVVQLECTMLSPFHRLTLHPVHITPNSTIFSTTFRLPDQHGIFNLRVNYKRPFFTNIDEKRTVSVRHIAHDEWPRSYRISGAWVWIAGIWCTVAGWIAFVALWLYSAPAQDKKGKKAQ